MLKSTAGWLVARRAWLKKTKGKLFLFVYFLHKMKN